jgi:hypothetical protein
MIHIRNDMKGIIKQSKISINNVVDNINKKLNLL